MALLNTTLSEHEQLIVPEGVEDMKVIDFPDSYYLVIDSEH